MKQGTAERINLILTGTVMVLLFLGGIYGALLLDWAYGG